MLARTDCGFDALASRCGSRDAIAGHNAQVCRGCGCFRVGRHGSQPPPRSSQAVLCSLPMAAGASRPRTANNKNKKQWHGVSATSVQFFLLATISTVVLVAGRAIGRRRVEPDMSLTGPRAALIHTCLPLPGARCTWSSVVHVFPRQGHRPHPVSQERGSRFP